MRPTCGRVHAGAGQKPRNKRGPKTDVPSFADLEQRTHAPRQAKGIPDELHSDFGGLESLSMWSPCRCG
jgi:hypothetical protein